MGGAEMGCIEEAFASNYIAPLGPMVDRFEADICRYTGIGHCAALSSGTAALHLALLILGVKAGDDVICPSFTFVASVNPIIYVGATPVLVDSEDDTWNMDPQLLDEAINDRREATGKLPAAIILVHLYGMPAKIDEIMAIADKYEIPVIEDAAEAIGARYDGKSVGTFGCMSVFSFNGNKMITTSGGGALVSDNEEYINRARFLATQARDDAPHYEHSEIGYNYRMSNIVAAIGVGQMEALPGFVSRCREINAEYRKQLGDLPGIGFLKEPAKKFCSNFWLTTLTIDPAEFGADREAVRLALEEENIESRPLWKPMHLQPCFSTAAVQSSKFKVQSYPPAHPCPVYGGAVSEALFERGLCLPSGTTLTTIQLERICDIVRGCLT